MESNFIFINGVFNFICFEEPLMKNIIKLEIVLNTCYGGFSLSKKAMDRLKELDALPSIDRIGTESDENYEYRQLTKMDRFDPKLVQVVKELGDKANGDGSDLEVEILNLNINDLIKTWDGKESIQYRYW
jgi:hypothetical protein